jgi:hypothetical protein
MKYLLAIMVLISANLMASQECKTIRIDDSCTPSGGYIAKFFSYSFKIKLVCETENNEEFKRFAEFSSLSASLDCSRFEEMISENDLTLSQLDKLIGYYTPFTKAKIKVIGSDIPTREEITKARMNSLRNGKKASSISDAMKLRRQ